MHAADGLVDHWKSLPEWTKGRTLWALYVTFDGDSELHALVRTYLRQLEGIAELDHIDPRWLHITVQGVAFADQLDDAQVDTIEKEAAGVIGGRSLGRLTFAAARPEYDGISMRVMPDTGIRSLRDELRSRIRRSVGGDRLYELPKPPGRFNPHVSIAYANATIQDAGDIQARLGRASPNGTGIDVAYVSLIRLNRDFHRWSWDHERRLQLRPMHQTAKDSP